MYRQVALVARRLVPLRARRAGGAARSATPPTGSPRCRPTRWSRSPASGYFFDLADLAAGETVVDLGSGSGTDVFYADTLVGSSGRVIGIDFTPEQLEKARRLAAAAGRTEVEFREGRIEALPRRRTPVSTA